VHRTAAAVGKAENLAWIPLSYLYYGTKPQTGLRAGQKGWLS